MEAVAVFLVWSLLCMLAGAGLISCFKTWEYHSHVHFGRDEPDDDDDEDDDDGDDFPLMRRDFIEVGLI